MSRAMRTRMWGLIALVSGVMLFWIVRRVVPSGAPGAPVQKDSGLVESVVRLIRANYVDEPDAVRTMAGGFRGLLNSLDALSSYLEPDAVRKLTDPRLASYKDVGLILFKRPSAFPVVLDVVAGSPAEKAGLQAGDLISSLEDRSTLLLGLVEMRLALKDAEARPVKVRYIRGNDNKDVRLIRAGLYPQGYAFAEEPGTSGILTVRHFFPPLVDEIRKTVVPLLARRAGPLIVDLRRAHEGDNGEARKFLNLFVRADKAGWFEKKGGAKEVLSCPDKADLESLPVVLWIDASTMGPAEIVAAGLRDLRKSKAVGFPTAGLTAQQELFRLAEGAALSLTTGIFVSASGEKVWAKGIVPEVRLGPGQRDTKAYLEESRKLLSSRS